VSAGSFRKGEFVYDPISNSIRCPGGNGWKHVHRR
jgi:hypothetical protein